MSVINQLRNAAKKAGLKIVDKQNGHFQIVGGALLVNYWPTSKKQTAYVAGTRESITRVTPRQAVELANRPPAKTGTIKKNRKKYKKQRIKLFKKQGGLCHWCNEPMRQDVSPLHPLSVTIEHVIPLGRNGLDNPNNIVLAHKKCNNDRGDDMPEIENG